MALRPYLLERGDRFFRRWGAAAVFFARWLPGLRVVMAWLAGANWMPWRVSCFGTPSAASPGRPRSAVLSMSWAAARRVSLGAIGLRRNRHRRPRLRDRPGSSAFARAFAETGTRV